MKRIIPALLLGALLAKAGIVAPGSTVSGKTVGEWTAEYWKWGMGFPASQGPFTDTTGELGHLGNVGGPVFFVNAPGGDFNFTIYNPEGQYLLLPMLTILVYQDAGSSEQSLLDELDLYFPLITGIYATIDGVPVPNPYFFDETSQVFDLVVPADGLLPAGTYASMSRGYWVMIEPLGRGPHTLSFGGELSDGSFFAATTVTINPVPEPGTCAMLLLGGAGLALRFRLRPSKVE